MTDKERIMELIELQIRKNKDRISTEQGIRIIISDSAKAIIKEFISREVI